MKTLKEHAYLHLRANGLTPFQSIGVVRAAITAGATGTQPSFECACNWASRMLGLSPIFPNEPQG